MRNTRVFETPAIPPEAMREVPPVEIPGLVRQSLYQPA
jgi:hypothetical protein